MNSEGIIWNLDHQFNKYVRSDPQGSLPGEKNQIIKEAVDTASLVCVR